MTSRSKLRLLRAATFIGFALPLAWLAMEWGELLNGGPNDLGANPVEYSIRYLGIGALRLLTLTLAISPLALWLRLPLLVGVRRQIGLWAFAYAVLHLMLYMALDLELSLAALWADVVKRRYITAGMAAFVLLLPLAATSTAAAIRWLGARRWKLLHRLIYPASLLACLHFAFMVKGRQLEPLVYAGIVIALLAVRRLRRR